METVVRDQTDNLSPINADDPGLALDTAYRRLQDHPAAGAVFVEAVLVARPMILPQGARTREAAEDALIDEAMRIVRGESTYDPDKLSLLPFLRMVVRRKVLNHLRGLRRRRKHEAKAARLENNPDLVASDDPPGNGLVEAEFESLRFGEVEPLLGEADFLFLVAVREGGDEDRLARVLGAPPEVARAVIRKAVDRITKKLRRKGLIP